MLFPSSMTIILLYSISFSLSFTSRKPTLFGRIGVEIGCCYSGSSKWWSEKARSKLNWFCSEPICGEIKEHFYMLWISNTVLLWNFLGLSSIELSCVAYMTTGGLIVVFKFKFYSEIAKSVAGAISLSEKSVII